MTTRICLRCQKKLPLSRFSHDRSRKGGRHPYCKLCKYLITRRWEENNPETVTKIVKRYRTSDRYRETKRRYCKTETFKAIRRRGILSEELRLRKAIAAREYRRTAKGREVNKNGLNRYNSKSENRIKQKARTFAYRSLGPATKCSMRGKGTCGGRFTWHHHKGYKKKHWLDVIPLCDTHHGLVGRKTRTRPPTESRVPIFATPLPPPQLRAARII